MSTKTIAVIRSMRPSFLLLTPVCVLLGVAIAIQLHGHVRIDLCVLVLIGALSAHISVNTFNEYLDFASGLDNLTDRTPFSGGSGGIPDFPCAHNNVLVIAVATLLITSLIGLYLVSVTGYLLLIPGLIGVLLILGYTRIINRLPMLCLISPGLAFGPFFVVGTYISVTDPLLVDQAGLTAAFLVSLVPFFLVNNLLLLNQFPDVDADKRVGRNTFPIAYGVRNSMGIYLAFNLLAAISIGLTYLLEATHWLTLIAVLPLILGLNIYKGVINANFDIQKMIPFMGKNVALTLFTSLAMGLLILVSTRL
jgi:1,4-dihydroxy-2-naphthoate octaprenyltransferase